MFYVQNDVRYTLFNSVIIVKNEKLSGCERAPQCASDQPTTTLSVYWWSRKRGGAQQ